jgi:hypothetical protein
MKANELRVGNKFECMGMIQTVFEIIDNTDNGRIIQEGYENIIRCKENGNQYKPIEIHGIPLTEEWLLKLGFIKYSGRTKTWRNGRQFISKYYRHYSNVDYFSLTFHVMYDMITLNNYNSRLDIKYVHQLQNLYFALTGKELEINI